MYQYIISKFTNLVENKILDGKYSITKNKNILHIIRSDDNMSIDIDINIFDSIDILDEYIKNNLTNIFSNKTSSDINSESMPIKDKIKSWIVELKSDIDPSKLSNYVDDNFKNFGFIKLSESIPDDISNIICETSENLLSHLKNNNLINSFHKNSNVSVQALVNRTILGTNDLQKIKAQPTPTFINRIAANHSSQLSGNGMGSVDRNDINVFVMDTGIASHPDLNIVGGRNFTTTDPNDWTDRNGHGTHVAGIIGAKDNDFGIVGVAPGVKLWAVKILGDNGSGSISNIINGINWILSSRGSLWNGYGIINMSIGGGISTILDNAVSNAINKGLVFCIAAGNSTINVSNSSPARVPNAITVGATENSPDYTKIAYYSNYGRDVDILAPGSNIYSTYLKNGYATLSGTSMATPVVTGTIALMLSSRNINNTRDLNFVNQIRNLIVQSSSASSIQNNDRTTSNNPRINLTNTASIYGTTNINIMAGGY